jgi:hypothetical protein
LPAVSKFLPVDTGKEIHERIGKLVKSYAVTTTLSPENQEEHNKIVRCLRKPSAVSDRSLQKCGTRLVRRCIFHL